ncbi:MAG TPA: STM3941 family protein [Ktedonobacteraceae bacterium]|nr:STM3941 family protein [Ktedonobacteraceae bacterium]
MTVELSQEAREIVFYSRRSRLGKYLVLFLLLDLFWVALLIAFLFVASGIPFVQPYSHPSLMRVVQILTLLLSLLAIFLVIWISSFLFFTVHRLISYKPALLVTSRGIYMQDLPPMGNLFLFWSEIASLSEYRRRSNVFLCLDLKEKSQFLSHFYLPWRFFAQLGALSTGTLIMVPHWLLSESVEEVLSRIQRNFDNELTQHHVRVSSTR